MLVLKPSCPPESALRLINPERGLYAIFQAELTEEPQDMVQLAKGIYTPDGDSLLLCEINLRRFADRPLTEEALRQTEELFAALAARGGSRMLRFLYDWDGRNQLTEPKCLDVILGHMRQLGPIVRRNARLFFLHQGLFIGNWGEMHGSRYTGQEDLTRLLVTLREAFGPELIIALRTLDQVEQLSSLPGVGPLGLYNDGIMGSVSDLGSYPTVHTDVQRAEALARQHELCREMPSGGEVVFNPVYGDFEQALSTLRRMRVTYLNRFHDLRALEHWAAVSISEAGLWQGVDGLSYVERHLGYRFVLRQVSIRRKPLTQALQVRVRLENRGFAPAYQPLTPRVILRRGDDIRTVPMIWEDGHSTSAGCERGTVAKTVIELRDLPLARYELYFSLWSEKYQQEILLGNEDQGGTGYSIGGFEIR